MEVFASWLKWISVAQADAIMEWLRIHWMNLVGGGAAPGFPYPHIEVWIILGIAAVLATVATVKRDEF